jgi:predicted nucleic acid-binding protein
MQFWDSSALMALVKEEHFTAPVMAIHQKDSEIVVWWSTRVECASALARRSREGSVDVDEMVAIRQILRDLFCSADEVAPVEEVRARAERLLAVHPLRASDALQLAAALIWARERPANLGFISLDDRLRDAALKEGFSVLP